jgi:heme/copper-type cytochrome/quinol oxidase subunit 2
METQYNKEHEIKEDYRPRPYQDNVKTKIWFINIAIIIVFFLFMYSLKTKK